MRTFLVILIIFIVVGIAIGAIMKYSGKGSGPSNIAGHDAFIKACMSPPYNNAIAPCEQAWGVAQGLGISTYAGWAKYRCDQGNC